MLEGRLPVVPLVSARCEVTRPTQLLGTEALGHPTLHLSDVTKLRSSDEMLLTPKSLSLLATSAPRAGSSGGLGTQKRLSPQSCSRARRATGAFAEPSDGLEPSTPSLPFSSDAGSEGKRGKPRARKPRKAEDSSKNE